MKWTILSDNRTDNPLLETEHGLSILLQTERYSILLDTGASDVFVRNAGKLGLDLGCVDYIFISHGHSDHAGGLRFILELSQKAYVIVSPDAVTGEFYSKRLHLHSITNTWPEMDKDRVLMIDHTYERLPIGEGLSGKVADGIHVMAHIPHIHPLPKGNQFLYVKDAEGRYVLDDFRHELVLYADGFLFTGCAHSGLENILSACPWPVHTVVGGFHLLDGQTGEDELTALARRLKTQYPQTQFYTSHCTGDGAFATMQGVMGEQLHAFGCGTVVDDNNHKHKHSSK